MSSRSSCVTFCDGCGRMFTFPAYDKKSLADMHYCRECKAAKMALL